MKSGPLALRGCHIKILLLIFLFSLLPVVYPTIVKTNLQCTIVLENCLFIFLCEIQYKEGSAFDFRIWSLCRRYMFLGPIQYKENTRIWFYVGGDIHEHDNFAILKFSIIKNPLLPEIWKWIIWCFWEFWHHSNSFRNQNF